MDVANEILDAIEIIVDKKIRENTAQIYPGVCKSVSGNSCVMSINGKDNTIQFYGSIPTVGAIYRVFVPDGNMSMAFAITGNDDRKGLHYSNPNLLDNWYFGNPVNQRGQTEYNTTNYAIDKWRTWSEPTSAWLKVVDGGIKVAYTFFQYFEKALVDGILGKNVTISILFADGKLFYTTGFISKSGISYLAVDTNYGNVAHVALGVDTSYTGNTSSNYFRVAITELGTLSDTILAIKLELGTQQTLAHQDENGVWQLNEIPDYGEQLARCQRYFQLYSTADNRPSKAVDCRPTMRTDPLQGTIIIDGTTYYYNTADL